MLEFYRMVDGFQLVQLVFDDRKCLCELKQ